MPSAEVTLPQVTGSALPTSKVVIRQELFKHDTAVFEVTDAAAGRRIKLDTPVRIVYGFSKDTDTFLGYVQSVKPIVENKRTTGRVQVVCIGASYALKNKRQKVHRGSRALIVQNVARNAKLTAAAEPTAGAITTAQAGKSDWELLVQLAREAGRVLYCHGVQVNFVSKDFWLEKQGRNAPVLTYGAKTSEPGTLLTFTPRLSNSDVDNPRGRFVIHYLDPRTKRVIAVTGDGLSKTPSRKDTGKSRFTTAMTEQAASLAEAEDRIRSKEELARFVHKAEVRCTGNARIHQGRPVYLVGVPEDMGGYWMVASAVHTITGGTYYCDLVLDTDSLGEETREAPLDAPVVPQIEDVIDPGFAEDGELTGIVDEIASGIDPDAALDASLEKIDDEFRFDPEGEIPVFGDDLLQLVLEDEGPDTEEIPIPAETADDAEWAARPGLDFRLDDLEQGVPLVETVPEVVFSPLPGEEGRIVVDEADAGGVGDE